jgi:hypothetical protein
MIRDIKKIICLKKASEKYILFTVVLVISIVIIGLLTAGISDASGIYVAFTIGACVYFGTSMFIKTIMIAVEVPRGLCFGMTRHKLFIWSRIVDFTELFIFFFPMVFVPGLGVAVYLKLLILCFGMIMWVEGLAANSILRFGKIAYWAYYFLFITLCMGVPRIANRFPGAYEQMKKFMTVTLDNDLANFSILVVFLLFAAAGLLINWLTFRTVSVDYAS